MAVIVNAPIISNDACFLAVFPFKLMPCSPTTHETPLFFFLFSAPDVESTCVTDAPVSGGAPLGLLENISHAKEQPPEPREDKKAS